MPRPSFILGHPLDRRGEPGERFDYEGERHILVFGPNGAGKGTRLLVPNLLQITDRSLVVVDPKGELAAITAPFRRTIGEVFILNPFGVLTDLPGYEDLASDGYNPLAALDPYSQSFNSAAAWLAEALISIEGQDPHWDRSAQKLLAGLIMHVRAKYGTDASLAMVRELLTEPAGPPDEERPLGRGLAATAAEMSQSDWPAIRNRAGRFTGDSKEIDGIVSSADTQTEALDDAEIMTDLSAGTLDFRDLKRRPITVYLILPPDMIDRHKRWLRLILSSALRGVMTPRKRGELRVSFILDEFAALGHLSIIESVWALVRGYGIQLIPVLQDLNQLKSLYGDRWETFIGMAGATLAFGPNDMVTADWMSRRSGEMTEIVESASIAKNRLFARESATPTISYQPTARPYLPMHDLFDTEQGHVYLWLAGVANVRRLYAPMYVQVRACLDASPRDNPYYLGEE